MPSETRPIAIPRRPARNKGRIVGQKRALAPKHVWSIRVRLERADNKRDVALFNTATDSKLWGCDHVGPKVRDVIAAGHVKDRAAVPQSKTSTPVRFEISDTTRRTLERWIADPEMAGSEFLWPSRAHAGAHL